MFYNFRKNKKAFTLVELIVVIAIIAILGAVVGVTVSTFVNRARKSAATTPLSELASKWSLKEDNQTLAQYIKDLYPEDYGSFFVMKGDAAELTASKGKFSKNFTIYFHNDNCGDYYGTLSVTNKTITAKSAVSTVNAAPTGDKTAVS